jgi:NDP-sugar pyrophosphorylase family protein
MDVKAILLIGGGPDYSHNASSPAELLGGIPLAHFDVLGLPVVEHMLRRLQSFGVSHATLLHHPPSAGGRFLSASHDYSQLNVQRIPANGNLWQAAGDAFENCLAAGADLVLILRLGAYAEVDYEALIQHHIDQHCSVTPVVDAHGRQLDQFLLNAAACNDAVVLFSSRMTRLRKRQKPFRVAGYVNRLRTASDLRRLAIDAFLGRNSIEPQGTQIRPGVWVHAGAKVHRNARIVAPAFIGEHAKIRSSAVITRASVVEHHAEVDCGTVVEGSTILPFTSLGAGLDVAHSVCCLQRLTDLSRNTEVEINDGRILGIKGLSPLLRMAGIAAEFLRFKLKDIRRGLSSPSDRVKTTQVPGSFESADAELGNPVMEVQEDGAGPSGLASRLPVSRRYGAH